MRRHLAFGSRDRGRGFCHNPFLRADLNKAAVAGLLSLTLAACASTPRQAATSPEIAPPVEPLLAQKSSSSTQIMIDSATAMIGQPYRYGGAQPGGFDCSGLVIYAAGNAGISLPRTAAEQMQIGRRVARNDLEAGDLIFLHLSGKEMHVAIALDRQLFVHAPSSGGRVRVDSLLAPPYAKGFIGARRVVSSTAPN